MRRMNRTIPVVLFLFPIIFAFPFNVEAIQKCIDANGEILYSRTCPEGYNSLGSLNENGDFAGNADTNEDTTSTNNGNSDHIISSGRSLGGGSSGGIIADTADTEPTNTESSVTDTADTSTPVTDTSTTDTADTGTPATDTSTADTADTGTPVTDTSTADTTDTSTPVTDTATADTTDTSTPVTDTTTADTADTSTPVTDTATTDTASTGGDTTTTGEPAQDTAPAETDLSSKYLSVSVQPKGTGYSVSTLELRTENKEIVINGANFGGGPNIVLYDTFDNGVTGEEIPLINDSNPACRTDIDPRETENTAGPRIGCWDKYGTYHPTYHDQAYSGSHSMVVRNGKMLQVMKIFEPTTEVFVSYRVIIPEGNYFPGSVWPNDKPEYRQFPIDSSWKFAWLTYHGGYDKLIPNICLPTHSGYGMFSIAGNDSGVMGLGSGKNFWSWDYWNRMSFWLRADPDSPLEPGDVIFQNVARDSNVKMEALRTIFDEDGPEEKQFTQINFPGWMRTSVVSRPLYDDVYIATGPNSVSRVELGDSPVYINSGQLEIQIPLAWSDSQIHISADAVNLSKFQTGELYLYITDVDGKVNTDGIDLSPLFKN